MTGVQTIEVIQKLVEYPDRRIKPIIYTMASSGIRIGAPRHWILEKKSDRVLEDIVK